MAQERIIHIAKQRLRASQVEVFAKMSRTLCFILLPWTVLLMINIVAERERWLGKSVDVVWVTCQTLTTLLVIRPQWITPRFVDVSYFLLICLFSVMASPLSAAAAGWQPYSRGDHTTALILTTNSAVGLLTFFHRDLSKTLVPCILFGLCASWTLWVESITFKLQHVALQMTISVVAAPIAATWEWIIRRFCNRCHMTDMVVALDGAADVIQEQSALAGFLLKSTQAVSNFLDHIADDDDRAQFIERLTTPRNMQIGLAENMQITLKDGNGIPLRLEALWFQYSRLDGQVLYMVGLRDFSDTAAVDVRFSGGSPEGNAEVMDTSADDFVLPEDASVTSGSVDKLSAVLVVDSTAPQLPIVCSSPGFRTRVGWLPADGSLLNYLTEPRIFETWLSKVLNNRYSPDLRVRLKMPHGEMSAICKVLHPETVESAEMETFLSNVPIVFYHVKRKKKEDIPQNPLQPLVFKGTPPAPITCMSL